MFRIFSSRISEMLSRLWIQFSWHWLAGDEKVVVALLRWFVRKVSRVHVFFFFPPFFPRAYQIFSSTFCLICASLMSYHDEKVIFRTEKIFIYFHAKFHISSSEQKYHIFPSFFSIFSPFLNGRLISTLDYFVHRYHPSFLLNKLFYECE